MIGTVTQSVQTYSFWSSSTKTDGADISFGRLITAANTADELMKKAPDKWVSEPGLPYNAIKQALEYREKELGVSSDAEPTHELTEEQRAWLNSRHDFAAMQMYVRYEIVDHGTTQIVTKATAEYSNFAADLAYLGVCSAEDFIQTSPLDTRPGASSTLTEYFYSSLNSDNSPIGVVRAFVKHLEKMFNFYDERSKDPLQAADGDAEFAELIKNNYLPLQKDFLELLEKLFGNEDEHLPQSGAVPAIEDISDKLKEDFGKNIQI